MTSSDVETDSKPIIIIIIITGIYYYFAGAPQAKSSAKSINVVNI